MSFENVDRHAAASNFSSKLFRDDGEVTMEKIGSLFDHKLNKSLSEFMNNFRTAFRDDFKFVPRSIRLYNNLKTNLPPQLTLFAVNKLR